MKAGQYYAVKWRTTEANEVGEPSPGFDTIEEARKWCGQFQNYVIRQAKRDGIGTRDTDVESAGCTE